MVHIAQLGVFYFAISAVFGVLLDRFWFAPWRLWAIQRGHKQKDKQVAHVGHLVLMTGVQVAILSIVAYVVRNVVQPVSAVIPYNLIPGYKSDRTKETGGGIVSAFAIFVTQVTLAQNIKDLLARQCETGCLAVYGTIAAVSVVVFLLSAYRSTQKKDTDD